jgi:osmoprotectant transport system ATP-binding protein
MRRLAVVTVRAEDLATPPVVSPAADMEEVRRLASDSDAETAVVVDGDGRLVGWVSVASDRAGTAGEQTTEFAAQVPVGTTLRTALGEMLQHDVRWVPVVDESGRYLGVLTPNRLHAVMRSSVGGAPVDP